MFNKITENVEIHQTLPDIPNMTAQELKREWDKGNKIIKEAFNAMIDELNKTSILSTILYENENGTNEKTINLSESCAKFEYIEIQYKLFSSNTTYYSTNKIYEANNKEVALNIITTHPGGSNIITGTLLIAFNGNVATTRRNHTFAGTDSATEEMYITKIIGYK